MSRLVLILEDDLAALARKGELVERYYNPENVFDEILVLSLNNDALPPALAPLFGTARVEFRHAGKPHPLKTGGYRRALLRPWLRSVSALVGSFDPDVIRTYGVGVSGLAAAHLKETLGIPFVCSTHDAYDRCRIQAIRSRRRFDRGRLRLQVYDTLMRSIERTVLRAADLNIVVYAAAEDYVQRMGGSNVHRIYNSVSRGIVPKSSYRLASPPRLLNVGRQTVGIKEPSKIIEAMDAIDAVLEIVGSGECHDDLVRLASMRAERAARVRFVPFQPNADIVASMASYDLFVYRYLNWEISKTVIEALLAGVPVVINTKEDAPVEEFRDADFLCLVNDTVEAWKAGILELMANDEKREQLGRRGRAYALAHFAPEVMERRHASCYRDLLAGPR